MTRADAALYRRNVTAQASLLRVSQERPSTRKINVRRYRIALKPMGVYDGSDAEKRVM
jgi:hypothetical protein